jgi:hypothetical protein
MRQLYPYKHRPIQILVQPEWIDWVYQYSNDLVSAEGEDVERRLRDIRGYKLATIAFAHYYGLTEQWEKKQVKLSIWPAWVDFEVSRHRIRIVNVCANEFDQLGYKINGKIWRREIESGSHDIYILTSWWAPYVDLIGWLTPNEVMRFPAPWGYSIQEPAVHSMDCIPLKNFSR